MAEIEASTLAMAHVTAISSPYWVNTSDINSYCMCGANGQLCWVALLLVVLQPCYCCSTIGGSATSSTMSSMASHHHWQQHVFAGWVVLNKV